MEKQIYEFMATQTEEKIVERKKCPNCSQEFAITDKDMEFYDKISPVFNGTKYKIPAPTLCPDCRQQSRLIWRNERKLYKRTSNLTGKTIVSMYSPEKPYKVYEQDFWRGDKWDALDYSRKFDFSRPFFEQFNELVLDVPDFSLCTIGNENSDYTNHTGWLKDCYMVFQSAYLENTYYSGDMTKCKSVMDCIGVSNSENSYGCIDCDNGYNLFFSNKSNNCRDSYFLIWCENCSNCFGCVSLSGKQYYIYNKEYTKNEYLKEIENILKNNSMEEIKNNFLKNIATDYPLKNINIVGCENCIGNNLLNSKDAYYSFELISCNNTRYSQFVQFNTDGMDHTVGINNQRTYYVSVAGGNVYNIIFGVNCMGDSSDLMYCKCCVSNCKNLFGCAGLKNKQYCILNKQYTKEEYEKLVPQIIEHMQKTGERGEFFPNYICPFGYNETIAMDYFPLTRQEALEKGYKWQDKEYPINVPDGIELVRAQDLSDNINNVGDDILKKALICEVSGKPFRVIKQELDFYRKYNLPMVKKHFEERFKDKMKIRDPRKLFLRTCDNCGKQVISVYPQDSEFKVYCEECYNKEIY